MQTFLRTLGAWSETTFHIRVIFSITSPPIFFPFLLCISRYAFTQFIHQAVISLAYLRARSRQFLRLSFPSSTYQTSIIYLRCRPNNVFSRSAPLSCDGSRRGTDITIWYSLSRAFSVRSTLDIHHAFPISSRGTVYFALSPFFLTRLSSSAVRTLLSDSPPHV